MDLRYSRGRVTVAVLFDKEEKEDRDCEQEMKRMKVAGRRKEPRNDRIGMTAGYLDTFAQYAPRTYR